MGTRLKIDLAAGSIEVDGESDFVQLVYTDFKDRLQAKGITKKGAYGDFYELLDEARISSAWMEHHRAYALYKRAFDEFPEGLGSSVLADILEGIEQAHRATRETERELPAVEAAVRAEPENPEKRFYFALALSRLGREQEAVAQYESALRNPEGLCEACFRDLWNNIGWFYYRQRNYREALKWFEQTYQVANSDEAFGRGNCALALENKILCYSALGMLSEAEAAAQEYVRRYGRLPWPERRTLARLNVDADAIYVGHHGRQWENTDA